METGLAEIRDAVAAAGAAGGPAADARQGSIDEHDVLEAYAAHLLTLAPVTGRRLKVVVDAGNGMAGYTAPAVFGRLGEQQVELVPMYFELDGTFPNHEANPIEPANLVDLQRAGRRRGRRHRPGLRRRRRPLLPRRRARSGGLARRRSPR